jgi:hypothetical protein
VEETKLNNKIKTIHVGIHSPSFVSRVASAGKLNGATLLLADFLFVEDAPDCRLDLLGVLFVGSEISLVVFCLLRGFWLGYTT